VAKWTRQARHPSKEGHLFRALPPQSEQWGFSRNTLMTIEFPIAAPQTERLLNLNRPYYEPTGQEIDLYQAAYEHQIPVLLKGPTGCGKTRFIHFMAWKLKRPLVTVNCHDHLTASDLVGRHITQHDQTVWIDGPLAHAVRIGAICYLDEVVEPRKDTTLLIHSLTDDRRTLSIEKRGEVLHAPIDFHLTVSYTLDDQGSHKVLRQSTRQRFIAIELDYPNEHLESKIIKKESGASDKTIAQLITLAQLTRQLPPQTLEASASTRLLVHAAKLIHRGMAPRQACHSAIAQVLTDEASLRNRLDELIASVFKNP
jgi:nitric oxide reductase NorQ protein